MPNVLVLISDFEVRASYFIFFVSHCSPLNNNSRIPETQSYVTNTKLLSVKFKSKDISYIVKSLGVNKVHCHDNIPIRMLKICDSAIVEPLTIIFDSFINQSMFNDIWKNSNIIWLIHKKCHKQTINNYRPVLLLPVCRVFQISVRGGCGGNQKFCWRDGT